ncbi:helix-turn-helix domain-containing protein [Bradyrhizobium guangzhouense]|uniref:helix-turn-helix domain-containing protein n=1 Tax=Bradyrhizobium guangzhouense TaxID=1325095 RepID=UPI001009E33B|nr:helix-turn-helix domain-containing protein [Bradyrhizobium guangzhouense]RXH16931.1 helix-turn-helix domain-containing protein [Bradyrhizobium guangzhouense]
MRRHSTHEIAAKLRQAEELMAHGQSQAQACKALGVSVMTFHRWRKLDLAQPNARHPLEIAGSVHNDDAPGIPAPDQRRIDELKLENERLRRIVTDLLLEKMKIEEQLGVKGAKPPHQ